MRGKLLRNNTLKAPLLIYGPFWGLFLGMLGVLSITPGCAPVAVMGGASAATFTAAEERGVSGFWDDSKIKSKVLWTYNEKAEGLFGVIDVTVRQGKVLLTGKVDNPHKKVEAVRLAWTVKGVQAVLDEVKVGDDTLGGYAKDSWITAKLKSKLVFDEHVHSINFNFQTIDGIVYIMGVARSQDELNRVLKAASTLEDVKEVVNYADVGKRKRKS